MTPYKTAQEFIVHQNRRFHFVSYEGHRAEPSRHREEEPAGWYLMLPSRRVLVMEQVDGMDQAEVQRRLAEWLAEHIDRVIEPSIAEAVRKPRRGSGRLINPGRS